MKRIVRVLVLAAACAALPHFAAATEPLKGDAFYQQFQESGGISGIVEGYKPNNVVETANGANYSLGTNGGAKQRVTDLVTKLTQLGALLAIAGIVYSGFLMVTSTGDDEKASQGKKGLIWSAAGFAAMVLAYSAVNAVVNMAYGTYG